MLLRYLSVLVLFAAIPRSIRADQVTLVNGDRLSGHIRTLDGGKLAIDTDMAGVITLPWSNVGAIVSTQPLYVVLKDGSVFTGTIVNARNGMRLQDTTRALVVPRDEIATLRSFAEQIAFARAEERRLAPHFLDPWSGFVDLGLSLARGNAEVTTYTVNANGTRTRPHNRLSLYFTSLYATNNTEPPASVTANVRRGGARMEFNVSRKDFAFVSADFEFDQLQRLDLRSVGGAGFGRHVFATNRNTLDLFAGATANREIFSTGLRRITGEALLSEESSHKIGSFLTLQQKFALFPNLTERGDYRFATDSSAVTTLLKWLSWQVSVSNRYISNPVPGSGPNDLLISSGFRFNLVPPK
jgi:putative salt-induced outer membrane protein